MANDKVDTFTYEDVQKLIDERLAEQQKTHDEQMESVRSQIAGGLPVTTVPEHAGGPGREMADTWSLAEQEASRAEAAVK